MNLQEFSIVKQNEVLLTQQISNHPNFTTQPIIREVVIDDVKISTKTNYERGFFINYYINHYNNGVLEKSFIKQSLKWDITDNIMIAERDFTSPTLTPIENPDYKKYEDGNKLGATIPNPNYVTDEELSLIPKLIKNPDYISDEETPDIINLIPNPDYIKAEYENGLGATIPNPNYVTDEELSLIPKFIKSPAFSYLLPIVKEYPQLLFEILKFYIVEQDSDKFFDSYIY